MKLRVETAKRVGEVDCDIYEVTAFCETDIQGIVPALGVV
jgi:hypothetical protein